MRDGIKKKANFSKVLCVVSISLFCATLLAAFYCSCKGYPTEIFNYAIPATGGMAIASICFYYNKAKVENLSKQRVRYVLIKLLLLNEIPAQTYQKICYEIDHIDTIIDDKITNQLCEAVSEDITAINTHGGY